MIGSDAITAHTRRLIMVDIYPVGIECSIIRFQYFNFFKINYIINDG